MEYMSPELLFHIFSFLPFKYQLHSRLVCRQWKNILDTLLTRCFFEFNYSFPVKYLDSLELWTKKFEPRFSIKLMNSEYNSIPIQFIVNNYKCIQKLWLKYVDVCFNYNICRNLTYLSLNSCILHSYSGVLSLISLSNLIYFEFEYNFLHKITNIPATLQYLLLPNNNFSLLPNLSHLSMLRELNMKYNHLRKIDCKYINSHIKCLDLSHNNIHTIQNVKHLHHLDYLNLSGNDITVLPSEFPITTTFINCSLNKLTTFNIKNLHFLTYLNLNTNKFTHIFDSICNLRQLSILSMDDNSITEIPDSIANLTKLQILSLNYNFISTLPYSFHKLIRLNELHLNGNKFNCIPRCIKHMNHLKLLRLYGNGIRRTPKFVYKLKHDLIIYL